MHRLPRAASASAVALLAAAAVPLARGSGGQNPSVLALVHATVIDGTGAAPRPNTTVLIRGARIVQVAGDGEVRIPAGARVVELRGKYVIPGLIDAHVHLGTTPRPLDVARGVLEASLMGGVTSVRDMGGSLHVVRPLALASRDARAPSRRASSTRRSWPGRAPGSTASAEGGWPAGTRRASRRRCAAWAPGPTCAG